MGRACCVPTCDSGTKVPVHLFPKDIKRCKLWLRSLQMQPVEQKEIRKLRVCYKHFCNYDYSCSPTKRYLKRTAIPSIHISSTNKNTTTVNTNTVKSEQNTVPNLVHYQNNEQIQDKHLESHLPKQEELILQDHNNNYVEQKEKQQHKEQFLYQELQDLREKLQHKERIQQHLEQLLHQMKTQKQKLEKQRIILLQHEEQMLYQIEQQQDLRYEERIRILQQHEEWISYREKVVKQRIPYIKQLQDAVIISQYMLKCNT